MARFTTIQPINYSILLHDSLALNFYLVNNGSFGRAGTPGLAHGTQILVNTAGE